MNQQTTQYDLIICGAGMVGAALACALHDSGLRIALIEASEPALTWPPDSIDLRVSAITVASEQIFRHLGVWQRLTHYGLCPFRDMHVWDANGHGLIHFDSADIGEARLGHIIENRVIQAALLEKLAGHEDCSLVCPARIEHFTATDKHVSVELEDGQVLTARLLVGADGGRSQIRRLAGIATQGWPYQQKAVVANVSTELGHQHTAWQRFLTTGPLAFLPLASGHSAIVWSTSVEQADELLAMDDETFCVALTEAFASRLGAVTGTSARAAFPLQLQHAQRYVQSRLALVGDAAHTIHPLAGQGVNLGLLDAAALAEVIQTAQRGGKDIGHIMTLRRYERWRKGDNLLTMAVMDGFKRLFGSRNSMACWLRNSGLTLTDSLPVIKNRLMRQAMGMKGDLPALARTQADVASC